MAPRTQSGFKILVADVSPYAIVQDSTSPSRHRDIRRALAARLLELIRTPVRWTDPRFGAEDMGDMKADALAKLIHSANKYFMMIQSVLQGNALTGWFLRVTC